MELLDTLPDNLEFVSIVQEHNCVYTRYTDGEYDYVVVWNILQQLEKGIYRI